MSEGVIVLHMCNFSTWEDETEGPCILGLSELYGKIGVGARGYSALGRLKQEDWEFKVCYEAVFVHCKYVLYSLLV